MKIDTSPCLGNIEGFKSIGACVSLDKAYARMGNKSLSIESCRRALEKDPHSGDAIEALKEVEGGEKE